MSQLYVALFGRAPDAGGLAFWAALRDSGQSTAQLADAMFGTAPARAYFPDGLGAQEIVASFYQNVLGRVADSEGLLFWTHKLEAAGSVGVVIAEMISVVANYDGSDPAGLVSASLYNNRVDAARFYAEHNGSIAGAPALVASVTADAQTVLAARVLSVGDRVTATIDASGVSEVVIGHIQDQVVLSGLADATALAFTFETKFFPTFSSQGWVVAQMGQDSGSDTLRVIYRGTYSDDHDGQQEPHVVEARLEAAGVEVIEVESSALGLPPSFLANADYMANALYVNDPDLRTLVVTGSQSLTFEAGVDMSHLSLVDARELTGANLFGSSANMGLMFWGSAIAGNSGLTIRGSLTNGNGLVGSLHGDVIVGGSAHDVIVGDGTNDLLTISGADMLTGGGGNDDFSFTITASSGPATPDTITDFQPNTVARGGAETGDPNRAPFDFSLRNGDVISLPPSDSDISVAVFGSAQQALGYLVTVASGQPGHEAAALDTAAGRLYIDMTHDGIADMAINLPGVTTITAAAFF